MSDITPLMGEWLCGDRTPPGPEQDPAYNASVLARAVGGNRAAGRLLGVAESTYRGWVAGATPRGQRAALLAAAARTAIAKASGRLEYARGDGELAVKGTITVSSDTRSRTIYPGRLIPGPLMRRILTYWTQTKDDLVETMLNGAIGRYYTPGMEFDTIDRVWFE